MCVSKAVQKQYFRRVYSAAKKSDRSAGNDSALAVILTRLLRSAWHFQMALFVMIKNDGNVGRNNGHGVRALLPDTSIYAVR